ncbi:DUF3313 family protein [Povalibacter sp.]|uniref:DUF3313 family protein n=1 Tax=Povalibacter sp. TaxID=1962978 RepID=UPI002F3F5C4C
MRDGVTFGGYTKFAVLDCYVAFRKNWKRDQNDSMDPFKLSDSDMERTKTELADEFKKVWTRELTAKGMAVVTTTGPDVLILRPAIINLEVQAPDTMQPGITHTFSASAGQATLFLELYDSVTSELLARIYDAEEVGDMGFVSVRNSVTNRSDADRMLKKWADLLSTHLQDGSRQRTGQVAVSRYAASATHACMLRHRTMRMHGRRQARPTADSGLAAV